MKKNAGRIDWLMLLPILGLMLFSIAIVYSASATIAQSKFGSSENLVLKHSIRILAGIIIIFIFAKIDYHFWQKYTKFFVVLAVLMLLYVLVSGQTHHGATRWIDIGPINFQPSEFAKFALVMHIAFLLATKQDKIKDFKEGMLPLLLWSLAICVLIALQPNYSTAFVIFIISILLMFIGNVNNGHLSLLALTGIIGGSIYAVSAPYRVQRLLSYLGFMHGTVDVDSAPNYQLQQALLGFGNGGFLGVGPGQSRQSHFFLPESYGDFIYSIIGEEYGYIGSVVIILIFIIITWRGIKVAKNAPDDFGEFLSFGIIATFAIYGIVNAAVNCGLLPTTGLPMPFVSYGGTAVVFYAGAFGIMLNISAQSGIYPHADNEKPDED
ncbi:MAG: hypothetical protein HW421_2281 [Ignavibacteria bacterium]|nr:hypothetical protein [Ignavibacteria bacterium]